MLAGFLGIIVMVRSFQNNIATESAGGVPDQHGRFYKEKTRHALSNDSRLGTITSNPN